MTLLVMVSSIYSEVLAGLQGPELNDEQRELEAQWGPPRGDPNKWASCLRVVDPTTLETASVVELDNGEAAISMCCVRFSAAEAHMLAVGTVQNLGFYPRAADGGTSTHVLLLYAIAVYTTVQLGPGLDRSACFTLWDCA